MTPEEAAALQARYGNPKPSFAKDVDTIVEVGRTQFGSSGFDDASRAVADVLGDKTNDVVGTLAQFDRPHEMLMHLANNEGQLKALAKLSPARQAVELARIEARMSSNGHVSTGAEPLYKQPALRSGRVSDEDWSRNFGEGLSDRQWNAEFDRRQASRKRR